MPPAEPTRIVEYVSTACAAAFLLVLPVRIWKLHYSDARGVPGWQGPVKVLLGLVLAFTLSSYWLHIASSDLHHKADFLASLSASILADLGLSLLLFREQRRSRRPSDLATLYLLASILCDIVALTMPAEATRRAVAWSPMLIRCCAHSVLVILENSVKRPAASNQSPEDRYGILSRVFFTWINPILLHGYRNMLVSHDMPPLSQDIKPEATRAAIIDAWQRRAKPETKLSLPRALITCLRAPFLAAVVPRLFLIIFRYSQPILIKESIKYVMAYSTSRNSYGYWIVVSAVIIYVGLAVSTAVYQHRVNKLKLMTRSALVGLIHHKTVESSSIAYDNGEATALISTDADSLDGIAEMVHETWAQFLEVLIGIGLLASQVGFIWPLLIFLIYLCSHTSRFVAKRLQPRQKAWNVATQDRLAATSSLLSSIKVVKMLGVQNSLTHRIQELREEELHVASKLRWIMVYYNASANALGIFSPAITLVIYAVVAVARGGKLDTEIAFTTVAILSMVTHPANMVMTIVPRAVAAFAGFERIQTFLLRQSSKDDRGTLPWPGTSPMDAASGQLTKPGPAVHIRHLVIGDKQPVLRNVDIEVPAGSFTIISGPTGSGKSTLLRAILGEISPSHGSISLSTRRVAYCAQRPWLPNGTIRDVIFGAANVHEASMQESEAWYREVTDICCLAHDFDSLPAGDQTRIGSRGLNLSGGQRQRVVLARALFARCGILLLDDTFSGLDGGTEQAVFDNLFGSSGLVRRLNTTVILVSNSAQHFPGADHIVVLGDNGVIDQGSWQNIKVKAASIAKFSPIDYAKDTTMLSTNFDKLAAQLRAKDETEQDLARQSGDPALYAYYLGFIDAINIFLLLATTMSYGFFITIPQYWLQLWTELGDKSTAFYVGGFLVLSTMSWVSTSAQMWIVLIQLAPQSGSRLHARLLHIITSAPLSFFSVTDNGSILNRFSQDIQLIDKQLPPALQSIVTQISKLVMQIILLCVAERWLAVSLPVCMLVVYVVQKVYLRTSRQLRFLELEARAEVFSSFLETIEGIETIRSFGWSAAVIQNNIRSVDNAQRPEFLLLCSQRWLNIVLDLLASAIATSVVLIAIVLRGQVSGAQVGIALNIMLVANTTLLKLVENWTTLEISLGAISRVKQLEKTTPTEGGPAKSSEPPQNWPSAGHIVFRDVSASYQSESVALRSLSLTVAAGQKLVVCGRTGSGKSTLLLTLLGLLELRSGYIELDGIDIGQVKLDLLRQRCFIAVSQDPLLLFNETLRFNLDPDASESESILIDALTKMKLMSHFFDARTHLLGEEMATVINMADSTEHPILDQKLSSFPHLSVGQCQLFALCRALVKARSSQRLGRKPVVVLDEVTSSLDTVTESAIYKIIDEEFTEEGHTVIIVAHRLGVLEKHMRSGRDAVVFMADGKLEEVVEDFEMTKFRASDK